MIDFLKGIDIEKTDEATVEMLKSMGKVVDEAMSEYVKGTIDSKKMEDAIAQAIKGIDQKEELKSVKEQIAEVKECLVKMKGAFEVKNDKLEVKSLEQQIEDQLKGFITTDKKGSKTVDLKEACRQSAGYKKTLNLVFDTKATVTSAGVAPTIGNVVDTTLSVDPKAQTVIRKFANVASIGGRSLTYAEFVPGEGDAAWVPEGGLKPSMDAELAEKTITAGKVALTVKLTEETLTDLPQLVAEIRAEIINRIGLAEEEGILNGTGEGGQIKGVATDMPGFSLGTFKIEKANTYDVIVAAYTQVVSVSNMAYRPNVVLMNPIDYAQMQLTKDVNGQYLRPFQVGDELIPGLRVEASTAVKQGDFVLGDFNYLNIRDVWALSITFGWEHDDFTKNLVTMIGEKRLMAYIKAQYKTAFVKDTIGNVVTAITKS
ncbi:MAG: phage major capsid protein [Bacteroidales bacterium]|nr:phage major capsid protein [Bacteroidales bacterium]